MTGHPQEQPRPAGTAPRRPAEVGRFDLLGPPVLSRSAVLRDEPLRHDTARQCAGWPRRGCWSSTPTGRVAGRRGPGGRPRARGGWTRTAPRAWSRCPTTGDTPPAGRRAARRGGRRRVLGRPRSRASSSRGRTRSAERTCAPAGAALDALGAGLLTTAVAVLNWHDAAAVLRPRRLAHPAAGGGLAPGLRGARARGLPPHRPRGHLPGARRRGPRAARPPARLARRAGSRCSPGSSRRGSRWRPACCGRSTRRSASPSATSPTWAARPGRSRAR